MCNCLLICPIYTHVLNALFIYIYKDQTTTILHMSMPKTVEDNPKLNVLY